MSPRLRKLLIVGLWAGAVIGWVVYQRSTGLSTTETAQEFVDTARGAWWAFLAFVLIYAARPLVLFPASVLTIAGGILFGPVVGIVATVVGANLSAMVAYWIARALANRETSADTGPARASDDAAQQSLVARWADRMRAQSFQTVMLMRLLFLPYDLVNYAAGFLRIRPLAFLGATALGSLPGTVSFTLAGASLERVDEGLSGLDLRVFAVSVVIFVVSLVVARWLGAREDAVAETDDEAREAVSAHD